MRFSFAYAQNRMTTPSPFPLWRRLWRCIRSYLLSELLLPFSCTCPPLSQNCRYAFGLENVGLGFVLQKCHCRQSFSVPRPRHSIVPHLLSTQNYNHLLPLKIVLFYYGKCSCVSSVHVVWINVQDHGGYLLLHRSTQFFIRGSTVVKVVSSFGLNAIARV